MTSTFIGKSGTLSSGAASIVSSRTDPPTVGYPRFRFVLRRDISGAFIDHGCYCLDGDAWQLLYTTPGTSDEWKALKFGA